ncbi:hypothetical protein ckin127_00030 [Helicobacter pylori]
MTYGELGKKVLEQAEEPLSVREIWERACEMAGKIPKGSFEIAIREDKKQFYVTNNKKRPFRYWLKSREREFPPQETPDAKEEDDDGQSECSDTAEKQKTSPYEEKEKNLHKLLVKFLDKDLNFKLQCKTIYHEKCKKTSAGKALWNYPDIVGVYFPYNKYFPYIDIKKKLWNFYSIPVKKDTSFFPLSLKSGLIFPI